MPHKVKLHEPTSILSEEDATAEIRNLLLNVGPLKSVWLHEDPKSLKQRATATYHHEKDARATIDKLGGNLGVQGITRIKYNVPK